MVGDDRARFCGQCQKHVYNLSSLTADEAVALIREREGGLCARFYRRADGTVLTSDCPVGAGQVWARVRRLVGAAVAFILLGVTIPLVAKPARDETPRARAKVSRAWDDAMVTIKTWLGYPPARTMIMGDICVVPPPAPPSANGSPRSASN